MRVDGDHKRGFDEEKFVGASINFRDPIIVTMWRQTEHKLSMSLLCLFYKFVVKYWVEESSNGSQKY